MRTGLLGILVFFLATVGYVAWHLGRLTPGGWAAKWGVALLFLLWMAAAFASMVLRSKASISTITALYEIGHPWMIAYLYLLIAFLLADLDVLLRLIPKGWLTGNGYTMAGLLGVIAVLLALGSVHYRHKYREELTLHSSKPLQKPLTVVLASDLHLGYSNRKAELARWIDLICAEQPDLVLFGGDIVDISLRPLLEGDYASEFARIQAPIYTVLGNHEYIGNEADAERFFADAGPMPELPSSGIPRPSQRGLLSSAGTTGAILPGNRCRRYPSRRNALPSCWTISPTIWRRPRRPVLTFSSAGIPTGDRCGPFPG